MTNRLHILAILSQPSLRVPFDHVFEGEGHRIVYGDGLEQAVSILRAGEQPDLIFVESGASNGRRDYERLAEFARLDRICLVRGMGEDELQEQARKFGIVRFLMKPVTNLDLESMIGECLPASPFAFPTVEMEEPRVAAVPAPKKCHVEELGENRFFLAASPAMLDIHRQVLLLARVDVPVLILGESGTGKEVIAHLIHKHSSRAKQRFLNVNCAALPTDLLESELFGYRQGAFTGAIKDKPGKFELADRGTLLLDEIGEISAHMQAKMLHVLQDGQFTRLGGQHSTQVDVRILAATNIPIETALAEKTFREDLYYRLNAFTIKVPPLRERREEIPYLIDETIRRTPAEMKPAGMERFSDRLIGAAMQYEWRGNLRELRSFVTRTLILQDEAAAIRDLEMKTKAAMRSPRYESRGVSMSMHGAGHGAMQGAAYGPGAEMNGGLGGMRSIVRDVKDKTETRMIQDALTASGWNRRHAAQDLNISYRALLYKIKRYQLAPGIEAM